MTGFPATVQIQPVPGIPGDFASTNPRHNVLAGPGALVAGSNLFAGRFCWADPYMQIVNCNGSGLPTGLVPRNWRGIITTYLAESTMQVQPGAEVAIFNACDMWVTNSGSTEAVIGQKAYARYADGLIVFGATGSAPTSGSGSASSIAAGAGSVTGSIAVPYSPSGDVTTAILTVTAVGSGSLPVGAVLSGTGVASGTTIVSQLTGTAGGVGTYVVTPPQVVASTAITAAFGTLTVGGTVTGTFGVGDILTGTGVTAGTMITALGTGTGGAGTYIVQNNTVVASTAITATTAIETKFICMSPGAPGEVVKISNVPLG